MMIEVSRDSRHVNKEQTDGASGAPSSMDRKEREREWELWNKNANKERKKASEAFAASFENLYTKEHNNTICYILEKQKHHWRHG